MDSVSQTLTRSIGSREQHFVDLLRQHHGLFRKIAWSFSRSDSDRADLLQDMAAQLWAVFDQWDPQRSFTTWAYRVALNVALAGQRRLRSEGRYAAAPEPWDSETDARASAADGPEQQAQLAQLQGLVGTLDPLNRALFLLYLDDLGYREIGDILGLSESNVGVRLNRLKARLRTQLETST